MLQVKQDHGGQKELYANKKFMAQHECSGECSTNLSMPLWVNEVSLQLAAGVHI